MKIGKANYEKGSYKKKNHFKLKDGDLVFRILPPLGELADKGVWSRYYSAHFGYKNTQGKPRPFQSSLVKNNKTKMIEVPDAAQERLDDLKSRLEKARAEGNGPLGAKLNTLVGYKGVYSVDRNHHMNVIALDGSIGELKIRHKAKMLLDQEIKKLRDEGVDPLSLEDGRFFVFTRSETGVNTSFKVSVYTQTIEVSGIGKVSRAVQHVVTPEILARLESEAFNLDNLFIKPSAEEVAQIVAESDLLSGKSPAVDRFIDTKIKARNDKPEEKIEEMDDSIESTMAATMPGTVSDSVSQSTGVATPLTSATPPAQSVTPQTPTTVVKEEVVTNTVPSAAPVAAKQESKNVNPLDLDNDEFFKMIGHTA